MYYGERELLYGYLRWVHNSCAVTLCPSLATIADLRRTGAVAGPRD